MEPTGITENDRSSGNKNKLISSESNQELAEEDKNIQEEARQF